MEPINDKEEEHFKKLMAEVPVEGPSAAFTQAVMLRVEEEAAFRVLMQQNATDFPSSAFTSGIMAQIRAAQAPIPAPIAAKPFVFKAMGYWIAAFWSLLVVACFFTTGNEQPSLVLSAVNGMLLSSKAFTQSVYTIPQSYMLTIIGLSCLLLLDYFLRIRPMAVNKTARS